MDDNEVTLFAQLQVEPSCVNPNKIQGSNIDYRLPTIQTKTLNDIVFCLQAFVYWFKLIACLYFDLCKTCKVPLYNVNFVYKGEYSITNMLP